VGQIAIIEAYSRLKALKDNVPDPYVHYKYVVEFHQILDLLEQASGTELVRFRIPDWEVKRVVTSQSYIGDDPPTYSDESYAESPFFRMRVDGVLTMFDLLTGSQPGTRPPVGFNPNRRPDEFNSK
jgi:hypothetical protein